MRLLRRAGARIAYVQSVVGALPWAKVFVVFVSHLARPLDVEAAPVASILGVTAYEARLALAAPPPAIVQTTPSRDRAADLAGVLRSRGHGALVFDHATFVPSDAMTRIDDFRLDGDGVRRTADGDLLPYGDVMAILRAVHETSAEVERHPTQGHARPEQLTPHKLGERLLSRSRSTEREQVAYFFRRSGERPWILFERHARYIGLGADRGPVAFGNFAKVMERVREASPMCVYDERLVKRHVSERVHEDLSLKTTTRTSREGIDLLAHLLAMSIANQGGSPYR